jgi:hypothetical protein
MNRHAAGPAERAKRSVTLVVTGILAGPLLGGCSSHNQDSSAPDAAAYLSRDALLDPETCKSCHHAHYADWSRSMHAYAADDPVFVAMNQRGQRETNGRLGAFCVNCHAPMAVRDQQTTDGLNLASLPQKYRGVTCFFCHSISAVEGTHNAALTLSSDLAMRGEYSNPLPNGAHAGTYSPLHDRDELDSAQACGSCHDIVNPTNAFIERTSCEWSHSAFNAQVAQGGQTCVQCHMVESNGAIAQVANAPVRNYHTHDFPGVDVALGPSLAEDAGVEATAVQQFLASSLHGAVCVTQQGGVRVIIDPVFLGHNWPSGAAQDRRAWAEVIAYSGANVIYQSGVVAGGSPVGVQNDPDLWLLRDQMLDAQGNPVDMFWQAASTIGNEIPALATFNELDPRFYDTHVVQLYPRSGTTPMSLPQVPDRVTFRMRLQAVGVDVLNDLVDSGDLDPGVPGAMPTFDVSFLGADGGIQSSLEWTSQAAASVTYQDEFDQTIATCVATNGFNVGANKVQAQPAAAPAVCAAPDDAGSPADEAGDDAAAAVGADADSECAPGQYPEDNIAPGLTKPGAAGALTFAVVSAAPVPPGVNYNTWVIKVLDSTGQPVTDATFPLIKTWMPLHGHPSSIVPTSTNNGDGTYTLKVYLFMPGLWQITPHVQTGSTTDSAVFTFCVGG